ncbi:MULTISPECIES: hypothetical protein [unclassified Burkholderia]|uniref:hypothetical protein n=1 Tax=unclassified Burkholderia TaxID=2613784 RepID=UPI000F59FC69|nr:MULTISPECIES: hypothetical protein [unclassified Burkholderia]
MKAWNGVEKDAKPILDYVKRPIFFDGPYKKGVATGKKVIFDALRRSSTLLLILEINFRIGRQF